MTEERLLKNTIVIKDLADLQPDYEAGTLVLTNSQAVVDECVRLSIPVAAYEDSDGDRINCQQILMDIDEIDDEDLERIYRRCAGIPWDIAYTNRCYIREFAMDDLDDLFALYAKPHMTDYMEPLFEYQQEEEYEANYIEYIYKLYGFGMWLIFNRFTGKLIGRAGIEVRSTCKSDNQAELGFAIDSDYWRQGYAYEVCSKIIEVAREDYGLSSLIARCDPANISSQHLLTKLGFAQVGTEEDGDYRFFREI